MSRLISSRLHKHAFDDDRCLACGKIALTKERALDLVKKLESYAESAAKTTKNQDPKTFLDKAQALRKQYGLPSSPVDKPKTKTPKTGIQCPHCMHKNAHYAPNVENPLPNEADMIVCPDCSSTARVFKKGNPSGPCPACGNEGIYYTSKEGLDFDRPETFDKVDTVHCNKCEASWPFGIVHMPGLDVYAKQAMIGDPNCGNCEGRGMIQGERTGRWLVCPKCVRRKKASDDSYMQIWASTIDERIPLDFGGDFLAQSQAAAKYSEENPQALVSVLLYEDGFTTIDRYVAGQLKKTDEMPGEFRQPPSILKQAGRLCNCDQSRTPHHHCSKHDLMLFSETGTCPKCETTDSSKLAADLPTWGFPTFRKWYNTIKDAPQYIKIDTVPGAFRLSYKDEGLAYLGFPLEVWGLDKFVTKEQDRDADATWNTLLHHPQTTAARKPMHDDSGAQTGLRRRPDYGESDSYTVKMNEANSEKTAGPFTNKVLLPAALGLGLGLGAPGAKEQKPPKPPTPIVQVQEEAPAPVAGPIDKEDVDAALRTAAKATHIPLAVLVAIAHNETSYGQNVNQDGLMQMTPEALAEVNKVYGTDYITEDMADPDIAALAAAQYLRILFKKFDKDLDATIAAYNTGPKHINKVLAEYGEVTPETLAASGHNITSDYLMKAKARMGPKKGSTAEMPWPITEEGYEHSTDIPWEDKSHIKTSGPVGQDVFPDGQVDFFEPVRDMHSVEVDPEVKAKQLSIDTDYSDLHQPGMPVGAAEEKKPYVEPEPYKATDEDLPPEFFGDTPIADRPRERKMWIPRGMVSRLIAARQKKAGGTDFASVATGKTVQDAFRNAVSEARTEAKADAEREGRRYEGYSGTIAEKSNYVVLVPPKGVSPQSYAQWVLHGGMGPEEALKDYRQIPYKEGQKCPTCKKGTITLSKEMTFNGKTWIDKRPSCSTPGCRPSYRGQGDKYTYTKAYPVKPEYTDQVRQDSRKIVDKWGPAGAIQLGPDKWYFFGFASS